jgi:hypothetical protein
MKQERVVLLKLIVLTVAVWGAVILLAPQPELPVIAASYKAARAGSHVNNETTRAGSPRYDNNDKLVWLDDYSAAIKEAKATGKPIFLEFRCAP